MKKQVFSSNMTYEQWCKDSKGILQEAEEYNKWRIEAKGKLLTDIGPRIEAIRKKGYPGCGFHYDKERQFGQLIRSLAFPWQPSANHCKKVEDDKTNCMVYKVLFDALVREVEEAERSS